MSIFFSQGSGDELELDSTKVHPGVPMSLLGLLKGHGQGVMGRSVSERRPTRKSTPSMDDGTPMAVQMADGETSPASTLAQIHGQLG